MRVLVACEFSGTVRDAFIARGHDAVSVDLLDSESPGPHLTVDIREIRFEYFDLMIAHPPCTYLATSGNRWYHNSPLRIHALDLVRFLMNVPVPRIAIENPRSVISSMIRKSDQLIQPWQFGHGETKATCLWLKNLPSLIPTDVVEGRSAVVHRMPPGPDRSKNRSRTYRGIAAAMAAQWG